MEDRLNGTCYICGRDLVWNTESDNCFTTDDIGDGYIVEEIICTECGTLHRAWVRKEDEQDESLSSVGDQGFGNCIHCGGTLVWSGDFMRSDYEGEDLSEDDDSLVRSLTCGGCGCVVEVIEPSKNEMKSGKYPHWKGYENI